MNSNLAIWIDPITKQAWIGKLNKKKTERLSHEVIDSDMLTGFIWDHLEAELQALGGKGHVLVYEQNINPSEDIIITYRHNKI